MKKLILLLFTFTLFYSCCNSSTSQNKKIYSGHRWDVIQLNDSIFLAVPGLNGDKRITPILYKVGSDEINKLID